MLGIECATEGANGIRVRGASGLFPCKRAELFLGNAGTALRPLTAALAQGKTFDAGAAESGSPVLDLPPITQQATSLNGVSDPSAVSSIQNVLFALAPGELSSFTPTQNGGFIAFLEKRVAPPEEEIKGALPNYIKTLQTSRQNEAFSAWMRKELELSALSLSGVGGNSAQ